MSTERHPTPAELLELVLAGKDEVIAGARRDAAKYMELYDRLGRMVALYLESPVKARDEIILLCDLEYDLTGDCEATGDISEYLDPEGEFFQLKNAPKYTMGASPERRTLAFLVQALDLTEQEAACLIDLKVTEGMVLSGIKQYSDGVSIVRVS